MAGATVRSVLAHCRFAETGSKLSPEYDYMVLQVCDDSLQVCSDVFLPRSGEDSAALPAAELPDCVQHQQRVPTAGCGGGRWEQVLMEITVDWFLHLCLTVVIWIEGDEIEEIGY